MDVVSVVDLAPWHAAGQREREALARAVDEACRAVGFMQIVGHGIEPAVCDALRSETERFFELPLEH
jgi:isopenicillin N synthase-like dioxygenase